MIQGTMKAKLYPELYRVEENHWWHRQKRLVIRTLLKRYCPKPGKVLDVGCGAGKILIELQDQGWETHGVDTILTQGKQRGLTLKKVNLQTEPLPFPANYFDAVICLDTLEHIQDDGRLAAEMARVVKKPGAVIISVPAYQWLFSYWDTMLGHFRRYNRRRLLQALPQKRLQPLLISYYFSFLLPPAVLVRLVKAIFGQKQRSDFTTDPLPALTHGLVSLLGQLELWWIKKRPIPFGLSLVGVFAKK